MYFVMNCELRAFHYLRTPLLVAVVFNLLNVTLDVLLVFFLRLSFMGAALDTALTQVLSFIFVLVHMFPASHLRPRDLKRAPARSDMASIVAAGAILCVCTSEFLGTIAFATYRGSSRYLRIFRL